MCVKSEFILMKMNEDSVLKIAATQGVIRNKFEKAYTNRIKFENEVNSATQPLTSNSKLTTTTSAQKTNNLESENNDVSKTTNNSSSLHLAQNGYFNHAIKTNDAKPHDPNTLCENLRLLLASSLTHTDEVECVQAINTILDELRKLDIM